MVASFDIFDTLLTRSVGNPKAVFLLLGRVINREEIVPHDPQHFANARTTAQRVALSKSGGKDVTLNQIYEELAFALNLDSETCQLIKAKELEIESLVLKEVPRAKDIIRKEVASGKKILFISDMYLPSSFIIGQLLKNGFEVNNNCYVSNEHYKTKHSGELFKHINKELNLPPSSFFHFGDNKTADFDVPRKLKWNAIHYTDVQLNRYEKILNSSTMHTDGLAAAFSGASRYTRLALPTEAGNKKVIKEITASVVAPVLTGFLLWTFKRAQSLGIKKIYYLSRDGQIFHKMAKILAQKLNLDIELHYLYSSRKTWQFAALTDITSDDLNDWILKKKGFLTIEMVFKRLFHKAEDFKDILVENGIDKDAWTRNLSAEEIQNIYRIFENPHVKETILKTAKEHRDLLVEYLDQERLTDGTPYAIADLGWVGTSQNFLAKILKDHNIPQPVGFYMALRDNTNTDIHGLKEGYFVNQILRVGYYKSLRKLGSILESFCHADHGSLRKYEKQSGRVTPVLEFEVNEKAIGWGLPLIHKTACHFCNHLLINEDLIDPYADMRSTLVKVLKTFGDFPELKEVKAWGCLELECNTNETKWNLLSEPYTIKEIFQSFYRGKIYREHYTWEEGSLVITPKLLKLALKFSVKAGIFARNLTGRK